MREVIEQVEQWKAEGLKPEEAYAKLMDTYTIAYVATQRGLVDCPDDLSRRNVIDYAVNVWMEGFLFGLLFQQRGGHRE